MKRIVIQVILVVIILLLAGLVWNSIQTPLNFEKEKRLRYDKVIESLKNIRSAQIAFKEVHGKYCGNWDSLITFVKADSIVKIRRSGMLTDSMIEAGIDEREAVALGLIGRDTCRVSVLDELFSEGFQVEKIGIIPTTDGEEFWLKQSMLTTGSGISVPVFEARAHNNQILHDLANEYKQEIVNLNEQCRVNHIYPGLKVGSVEEPNNNSGNWE